MYLSFPTEKNVMACGSKAIVFLSILGIMVIIPLGLFVVANVLPTFYSSRSKLIKELEFMIFL